MEKLDYQKKEFKLKKVLLDSMLPIGVNILINLLNFSQGYNKNINKEMKNKHSKNTGSYINTVIF